MSTYHHLLLNSEDREDRYNTNPANCRIQIPKLINPRCIELSFMTVPVTFYNINNTNNIFAVNGTQFAVPIGCYSLTDLLQTLATLLNAITPVINYDDVTNLITIAAPANFTINLGVNNSLADKLGFLPQLYSGTNTYTATFGPKLYDTCIYINIAGIPAGVITSNSNLPNATFVVPINVNKSEVAQFYSHSQFYINPKVSTSDLQYFDIRFLDTKGMQIQGLSDWTMMVKISV